MVEKNTALIIIGIALAFIFITQWNDLNSLFAVFTGDENFIPYANFVSGSVDDSEFIFNYVYGSSSGSLLLTNQLVFFNQNGYIAITGGCKQFTDYIVLERDGTSYWNEGVYIRNPYCQHIGEKPAMYVGKKDGVPDVWTIRTGNLAGMDFRMEYFYEPTGRIGSYELLTSKLNFSEQVLFKDGVKIQEIDSSNGEIYLTFNRNDLTAIIDPKFRYPFNCILDDNDLLAVESFAGGRTIDLFSTRFKVKSFCLEHQAIITDIDKKASTSTAEIYNLLYQGKSYVIPNTQTVTLFYIFDNTQNLVPTTCDFTKEFYKVDESKCVPSTGVVQICSEGIFDPNLGTCTIETTPVCEKGRLEFVNNTYTCVLNPPVNQVCSEGTFNSETGKCETPISGSCPSGYVKSIVEGFTKCTIPLEQAPITGSAPIRQTSAGTTTVSVPAKQLEVKGVKISYWIIIAGLLIILALYYFLFERGSRGLFRSI